ncbi:MAG TPA: nucleotide sugar dehydrogenase [Candidatus Dormibacteraeota bacterium]|nr:nucleotide sugar dehydrogenase [Candidatus Dormibacteraeota bacterium]
MTSPAQIGIVGLGTIGSQELALWHRTGHTTVGYDISKERVSELGHRYATSDLKPVLTSRVSDLAGCSTLILCLPNLLPSLEISMAAFDQFAGDLESLPVADRLVVIASTVPIGFTREFAARIGPHGRVVAHAPERFDPGRGTDLGEIPRVVGGLTLAARDMAVKMYNQARVVTYPVDPVEVAEASKLLENAFRLVNIGFINEFAELCRRVGLTAADVIDAASTKPFAFMAHQPGVGAGGTCIPTMPRYLLQAADQHGLEMPMLQDAVASNQRIVEGVSQELRGLLRSAGVSRGRVLVVGATYKPNYPDPRGSAALAFARGLAAKHDVVVFDPIVDTAQLPADVSVIRELPRGDRFDAVVIALKHRDLDVAALREVSPILIDLVRGAVEVTESISTHQ